MTPELVEVLPLNRRSKIRNEYELTTALDLFVRGGGIIRADDVTAYDANLTTPLDVLECNLHVLALTGSNVWAAPDSSISDSAILDRVVVGTSAVVGPGVALNQAVVFDNTSVGEGSTATNVLLTLMGLSLFSAE